MPSIVILARTRLSRTPLATVAFPERRCAGTLAQLCPQRHAQARLRPAHADNWFHFLPSRERRFESRERSPRAHRAGLDLAIAIWESGRDPRGFGKNRFGGFQRDFVCQLRTTSSRARESVSKVADHSPGVPKICLPSAYRRPISGGCPICTKKSFGSEVHVINR